jgi:hypothetical protein
MSQHTHQQHEPKQPIGWMDRPDTVKRLFTIFYFVCVALVAAEILVATTPNEHPHPLEVEMRYLVYPVYGFLSFWFLVLVARGMRKLLIRSEDYYDGGGRYEEGADG